jgi:hypothetical protein
MKMSILEHFLMGNSIKKSKKMPLVHTTRALHLKRIANSETLKASFCQVFQEDLNYFFVGRPAYKHKSTNINSIYWELPVCFIMNFYTAPNTKRIYPFDSGAFHEKRYPSFFQIMDINDFEITSVSETPERIMGAFFGTVEEYFHLRPKSERDFEREFLLKVFEEEIRALHMLASLKTADGIDDRRLCIEVQSSSSIPLRDGHLQAVVCPSVYLDDKVFLNVVEKNWGAQPIPYPIHSLNYDNYVGLIYERVEQFYISKGILSRGR